MTVLTTLVLIGSLMVAGKPCNPDVTLDACANEVGILWSRGDVIAAGAAAEVLFERSASEGDAFIADGARFAFIAAIGRYVTQSSSSASYWLWVASRHETECGTRLLRPYRQVVDRFAIVPGVSRRGDRVLARSPYLASPEQCRDLDAGEVDLQAVPSPESPAAVVFFEPLARDQNRLLFGRRERVATIVPQLLYEYPAGAVSPSSLSVLRGSARSLRHQLDGTAIILSPCSRPIWIEGELVELCRADVAGPEAE